MRAGRPVRAGVAPALAVTGAMAWGTAGAAPVAAAQELGAIPLRVETRTGAGGTAGDGPAAPVLEGDLAPLARALADRRIVLLGENGHGVGTLTTAKVALVEWLHREMGFDVVAMESGFFECGRAWDRIRERTARQALFDCLRHPFQHAEILPLFQRLHEGAAGDGAPEPGAGAEGAEPVDAAAGDPAAADTETPLVLAGIDPQPQGFDSGGRPETLHRVLAPLAPELARRVAAMDSALFLVPDSGGLGEGADAWILENGAAARAAYDSAAALTDGATRHAFRLAAGLVERLEVAARADAAGAPRPSDYYELRDLWMARAVAALADSVAGPRRVVVWLHNDHARYGTFPVEGRPVRSVGSFLRAWYGDEVFSVGFFMGPGRVADNGRRILDVEPLPSGGIEEALGAAGHPWSYLLLGREGTSAARAWAASPRPYLRMGIERRELAPGREFDALFWVDRAEAPEYRIP